MVTFVLILFFHVGAMGNGNSNAVDSVPGFKSSEECLAAGAQAKKLVSGTVKELNFACVKQTI
jgi:hypothetical protein